MIVLLSSYPLACAAGVTDVVNATVLSSGQNTYTFTATLKHADTGWDHYANKWVVEGEDGTIYGTRILHHPHVNEQPFTRSLADVNIPDDVDKVIIRAYDSVHGDGGEVFKINMPK